MWRSGYTVWCSSRRRVFVLSSRWWRRTDIVEWWKSCSCRKNIRSSRLYGCSSIARALRAGAITCGITVMRSRLIGQPPCLTSRINRSRCGRSLSWARRLNRRLLLKWSCLTSIEPKPPLKPSVRATVCNTQQLHNTWPVMLTSSYLSISSILGSNQHLISTTLLVCKFCSIPVPPWWNW